MNFQKWFLLGLTVLNVAMTMLNVLRDAPQFIVAVNGFVAGFCAMALLSECGLKS